MDADFICNKTDCIFYNDKFNHNCEELSASCQDYDLYEIQGGTLITIMEELRNLEG